MMDAIMTLSMFKIDAVTMTGLLEVAFLTLKFYAMCESA